MKKSIMTIALSTLTVTTLLSGCSEPNQAQKTMAEQNTKKTEQAARMMNQVQTPTFNRSLERENIKERLVQTNDPNMLQWIYPMSAGRVIGRFPVRGKVTSGSKRLTSTQMFIRGDGGSNYQDYLTEAPDEMGAYGSSGEYIFWFDPAGRYHQHRGDYFLSPVPYKIDIGNGMISVETDQQEEAKRNTYESQIKQGVKK